VRSLNVFDSLVTVSSLVLMEMLGRSGRRVERLIIVSPRSDRTVRAHRRNGALSGRWQVPRWRIDEDRHVGPCQVNVECFGN